MPFRELTPHTSAHIRSSSTVYATARSGSSKVYEEATTLHIGQLLASNVYTLHVALLRFDTSDMAADETVTNVDLTIYGVGDQSVQDFDIEAFVVSFGSSLTASDWPESFPNPIAAELTTTGFDIGEQNTMDARPIFDDYINKGGFTDVILVSRRHRLSTAPDLTREYVSIASSNDRGLSAQPKLQITSTVPTRSGDLSLPIPRQSLSFTAEHIAPRNVDLFIDLPRQTLKLYSGNVTGDLDLAIPRQSLDLFGGQNLILLNFALALPLQSLDLSAAFFEETFGRLPSPTFTFEATAGYLVTFSATLPRPIVASSAEQTAGERVASASLSLPRLRATASVVNNRQPEPLRLRVTNIDRATVVYDLKDRETAKGEVI